MRPAHAVSNGCEAARAGTFNLSASNGNDASIGLPPGLTFAFNAGDTLTFTFAGNPTATQVQVNGANVAVTGNVAQFSFPSTGSFSIFASLTSQNPGTSTLTVTCGETTGEKTDAVRNAIKTLTGIQLNQSISFQSNLLQDLTDMFVAGAAPATRLAQLESLLAALEAQAAALQERYTQTSADRYALLVQLHPAGSPPAPTPTAAPLPNDPIPGAELLAALREYFNRFLLESELERYGKYSLAQLLHAQPDDFIAYYVARFFQENPQYAGAAQTLYSQSLILQQRAGEARDVTRDLGPRLSANRSAGNWERVAQLELLYDSALAAERQIADQISSVNAQIDAARADADAKAQELTQIAQQQADIATQIAKLRAEIAAAQAGAGQQSPAGQFAASQFHGAMGFASHMSAGASSNSPFGLTGSAGQVSFFTDLKSMLRAAHGNDRLGVNGLGPNIGTGLPNADMPFNAWLKGTYSTSESNQPGADRDSRAGLFATGAYYAITPRFMVGAMYRYRDARSKSNAQGTTLDGRGHGLGVYSTWVITPILSASGQALYEWSSNDLSRDGAFSDGTSTGQFDATQLIVNGQVQRSFNFGPWWLRPTVAVTYARAEQHSFTDSAGTFIDGQSSERGQLSFGPRIGYRKFTDGVIRFIEPSVGVNGTWDFLRPDDTTLASGVIIASDIWTAQLSGALAMQFANGGALSFSLGYSGFGRSEVESLSVTGQLSMPLY